MVSQGGWAGICLVLALFVALPANAQDFQKGFSAHNRGDYATALKQWRPLAEQGHAKAQYKLGSMYESGRGVPQDYAEAVRWFTKAAQQGHANAQFRLGLCYFHGQGIPKNIVQAYMWWGLAASEGHRKADVFLDRATKSMTPAQISKAKKLARGWWAKHSKKK